MTTPQPDYQIEQCGTCHAEIIWAVTTKAKRMPVDKDIHAQGNVLLADRGGSTPLAKVLTVAQQFGMQGKLRRSHFATCPDANKHRRK